MNNRTISAAVSLTLGLLVPSAVLAEPRLELLSTHHTGVFVEGAAEIATFDPVTKRIFFMNGDDKSIQVLDASDPSALKLLDPFSFGEYGNEANSVACANGLIAVAVEMDDLTQPGAILLYKTDGTFLYDFAAGSLPDAVAFSPSGDRIVVACEGEPSDDYATDPEGTITVIDLKGHRGGLQQSSNH